MIPVIVIAGYSLLGGAAAGGTVYGGITAGEKFANWLRGRRESRDPGKMAARAQQAARDHGQFAGIMSELRRALEGGNLEAAEAALKELQAISPREAKPYARTLDVLRGQREAEAKKAQAEKPEAEKKAS